MIDRLGVDREEQKTTEKVTSPGENVWAKSELMMEQFEERLRVLVEESDVDKNGFIDKEEFKQIVIGHLKYSWQLHPRAQLSAEDEVEAALWAEEGFDKYDKNRNGRLDPMEIRKFYKNSINAEAAREMVDMML